LPVYAFYLVDARTYEEGTAISCGRFLLTYYFPFCIFNPSRSKFLSLPSREKSLAFALVAGRVLHPGSKLSLSRHCLEGSRLSSLAQVLGVEGATEGEFYKAIDWLLWIGNSKASNGLARMDHRSDGGVDLPVIKESFPFIHNVMHR
jgi:hypothetical protein